MTTTQEQFEAIKQHSREDLISFSIFTNNKYQVQPYHKQIAKKLQEVMAGTCKRLIISLPPRAGKSQLAAINFPAFVLGNDPTKKVVVAGYGQDLPNYFSKQTLELVQSPEYGHLFQHELVTESVQKWDTKQGGYYLATGVGGSLTGFGFDIGIIDDPVKNREEAESIVMRAGVWNWYTSTFRSRMTNNSAIIIIMTRWHIDDLTGRILKQEEAGGEQRDKIIIPAITEGESIRPERYDMEWLNEQKNQIGVRDFAALYMQDPILSTGSIFKPSDFKYFLLSDFEKVNGLNKKDFVLGAFIDPAFSTNKQSDDAVVMICGREKNQNAMYIFDIYADTSAPSRTIDSCFNLIDRREMMGFRLEFISLEKNNLNRDQTQFKVTMQEEMSNRGKYYTIYDYVPDGKKQDRIKFHLEPIISNRKVYFIKQHGDYNAFKKLEEQLTLFPSTAHDDVIDCTAQAVTVFKKRGSTLINPNLTKQQKQYFDKITGKTMYIA